MTQLQSRPSTDTTSLESLLRNAHDRSARGNATRRDWERVAAIDRSVARRELATFLRTHANAVHSTANPYENNTRIPGAVVGFVIGVAAVAAIWTFIPWVRDTYIDSFFWQDVITTGQFFSTVLIPIGIFVGARWSAARQPAETEGKDALAQDASFEEMLDAFEQTQHVGRARVY